MTKAPRTGAPFPHTYWDDFAVGDAFAYGAHAMTEADILRFAREFDPEPFHVDVEAAKATPFRGLIASGPHTAAIWRRINRDAFPHVRSGGSPGWDELRWLKPVRPGDVLSVYTEVVESRPLKSRPDFGFLRWRHETRDRAGELKMTHQGMVLVERRPAR